jgi:hypothetical protein
MTAEATTIAMVLLKRHRKVCRGFKGVPPEQSAELSVQAKQAVCHG